MIQLVYTVSCLLLLLLAPSLGPAQPPPVRIGTILPYTGVLSVQGTDTTYGLELYLKKIGSRAGGRAIELLKEDTEAKPDVGLTKIKKLIEHDRVDFVVGPVNSAVALAVRNYVHEQGVPLVVPVAFTRALTAPPLASPAIFRQPDPDIRLTDAFTPAGGAIAVTKYNLEADLIPARRELDPKRREQMYHEIQRKLMRDVPMIPLMMRPEAMLHSPKLQGMPTLEPIWGLDITRLTVN